MKLRFGRQFAPVREYCRASGCVAAAGVLRVGIAYLPRNVVILAQAGIRRRNDGDRAARSARMDPRLRGDDDWGWVANHPPFVIPAEAGTHGRATPVMRATALAP